MRLYRLTVGLKIELRGRWAWSKMETCFSSTPQVIPRCLVLKLSRSQPPSRRYTAFKFPAVYAHFLTCACAFPHLAVSGIRTLCTCSVHTRYPPRFNLSEQVFGCVVTTLYPAHRIVAHAQQNRTLHAAPLIGCGHAQ